MPKTNQNKDGCNKKLNFVILEQVNVTWLSLLQTLAAITSNFCGHWKLLIFKNENSKYGLSSSCKHFIRLISLSSVYLERPLEVAMFVFFRNKQGIHAYIVSNFHLGWKNVDNIKNFEFSYRVEISSWVG